MIKEQSDKNKTWLNVAIKCNYKVILNGTLPLLSGEMTVHNTNR